MFLITSNFATFYAKYSVNRYFFRTRPSGEMANASDYESEDCGFESRLGQCFFYNFLLCF